MHIALRKPLSAFCAMAGLLVLNGCATQTQNIVAEAAEDARVNPLVWPQLNPPPLDPEVEAIVDVLLAQMSTEQKVGQVIQADSDSVTPEEVRRYRLGSVLSGGNSAPGDEPYAAAADWLEAADAFWQASVDPEGVEVAIPIIWGIDAVHGHANLLGATVFPQNIGLGAANDPDLIEDIMEVTAAELIVSGHDWTFAPTLAVPRDDRWGRTYEGFSEDPAIVAAYADRIVYGLQGRPGTDSFFDMSRVISSAKHFVGDGGTANGVDQGDTRISEEELRDIHAAGYFPAIEAGVQTIMASFNSWNGVKMHGDQAMLTNVLKDRMGFNGFVIGDWNGHGHIPGCTNTSCPQALLAGVDMYMAPASWRGIYESTLASVESGEIPMSRLDDAVRRILRVKVISGVIERPQPSARPGAGETDLLGSPAHREVARRAVRQSLVLLKNNDSLLPLDRGLTVLVIGEDADSISTQSGGWTLSWQGGGYDNSLFPNGQSILSGIREVVSAGGGTVIYDPEGTSTAPADVVIAVYGEQPYAEFHGDRATLDFEPNTFDTARLDSFNERDIPVVSVFLSGRPLWVNPELNASQAFVAAWLPGTEGGGIADVLFQTEPDHDFTGRLSFSWPATAVDFDNNAGSGDYAPLFPLGYGLSYTVEVAELGLLPEESGIDPALLMGNGAIFQRGAAVSPWFAYLISADDGVLFNGTNANLTGISAVRADYLAQEDAITVTYDVDGMRLAFIPEGGDVDWSGELAAGEALVFAARVDRETVLSLGLNCIPGGACEGTHEVTLEAGGWREVEVALDCLSGSADLSAIDSALIVSAPAGTQLGLADIRVATSSQGEASCGG